MRRRCIAAGAFIALMVIVVSGMFGFSSTIAHQERAYREQGTRLGLVETMAVDAALWWSRYGRIAGPATIAFGIGCAYFIGSSGIKTRNPKLETRN
jgi:hypothetical protein